MLETYVRIEQELRRVVDGLDPDGNSSASGRQFADHAHRNGVITGEALEAFHRMA